MPKFYSKVTGSTGVAIGTIISVFKSGTGSFDISQYPGFLECDGSEVSVAAYPALYAVIGTHYGGTSTVSPFTPLQDRTSHTSTAPGTFKLPNYRGRKLVGVDGVDGAGSPSLIPSNAPNGTAGGTADVPGSYGGSWIMTETRQGAEYFVGNVTTSGYTSVIATIDTSITGSTSVRVGPVLDTVLRAAPAHTHILLTSNADPNCIGELGDGVPQNQSVESTYMATGHVTDLSGFIFPFSPPDGTRSHTHKLSETNLSASRLFDATYDTTNTRGDNGSGNAFYNSSSGTGSALSSSNTAEYYDLTINVASSGLTVSTGEFALTGSSPISVTAVIVPNGDVPLVTRYFRVKYLIKAF